MKIVGKRVGSLQGTNEIKGVSIVRANPPRTTYSPNALSSEVYKEVFTVGSIHLSITERGT